MEDDSLVGHITPDRDAAINASQFASNRQQALRSELLRLIERNQMEFVPTRTKALQDTILGFLSRPNGIGFSLAFLQKLAARIEIKKNMMIDEASELQGKLQKISAGAALAVVQQAAKRFLVSRGSIQSALVEYGAAVSESAKAQMEIDRRQAAAQLFTQISAAVQDLLTLTRKLEQKVELIAQSIEERRTRLQFRRTAENPFERRLETGRMQTQDVHVGAAEFLSSIGSPMSWAAEDTEALVTVVLDYVRRKVQASTIESVEKVVSGKDLIFELNQLGALSTPLWQYDKAQIPVQDPGTINFFIYGVSSVEDTALRDSAVIDSLPRGTSKPALATTNDSQSIYQLQIEAGLPLFALKDIKDWKEEYENPSLVSSGHVMAGGESFADILGTEDRMQALRVFTLSVSPGFNLIRREAAVGAEAKYYLTRQEGLKERRLDLGSGRLSAYRSVVASPQLVDDLASKIRQVEQASDYSEMIKTMTDYYRSLDSILERNPDLAIDMQHQLRRELEIINQYVEDLQASPEKL
jgi:hypothetical protein